LAASLHHRGQTLWKAKITREGDKKKKKKKRKRKNKKTT